MSFDVKITTSFNVLDLIAPFSCRGCGALGSLLCERCKKYNISLISEACCRCRKNIKTCCCENPVVFAGYREGVLMQLVEDYKYKSIRATAGVLAEILAEAVVKVWEAGRLGETSGIDRANGTVDLAAVDGSVVVVPLPTISRHIRERGFDHMRLLAKKLARVLKKDYELSSAMAQVLERRNKTVQVGASGEKRRRQASEAYGVSRRWLRRNGDKLDPDITYLLVDDVWTTGASMEAAIKKMREAGAKKIVGAVILAAKD